MHKPIQKKDNFLSIAMFSALLACGIALYLFWQNQQLEYQLKVARSVVVVPTTTPSPSDLSNIKKDK